MEKINASFNLIGVKGWLKKAFIISVVKILLGFHIYKTNLRTAGDC